LPAHHFCLVHRVHETANINGKKLLCLKPVVRTQRSYKRVGLQKWQKSFQGLAMYSHEVLISLLLLSSSFSSSTIHSSQQPTRFAPIYSFVIQVNTYLSHNTALITDAEK
jgi:hypothetical protein